MLRVGIDITILYDLCLLQLVGVIGRRPHGLGIAFDTDCALDILLCDNWVNRARC